MNVERIIAYEQGQLDEEETVEMFQDMINDGTVWQLQGHYGRAATALINAQICYDPREKPDAGIPIDRQDRTRHDSNISVST